MATRAELAAQRKLDRIELTKISKAIMFSSYFNYGPNTERYPQYTVRGILLRWRGTASSSSLKHIEVNILLRSISNPDIEVNIRELDTKGFQVVQDFVTKHNHNTRKLIKDDPLFLQLDRVPTEEERDWADSVFTSYGLSKDSGSKNVKLKFTAVVEVEFNSHDTGDISAAVDKAKENAQKMANATAGRATITFKDNPENIQVLSTRVVAGRYPLDHWPLYETDKGKIKYQG